MAVSLPPGGVNLESQLSSIMDALVKAAVVEISQLFCESSAELRLHLTQSLRENDSLRTRVKLMRSEIFSLKLQTRAARPSSRFGILRANTPKPRVKAQAPAVSEDQTTFTVTEKKTPVECPDVILIKDEDESEEVTAGDIGSGSAKMENENTVDIPSQAQEAFIDHSGTFYNTSDSLAFTSLPTMQTASHDLTSNEHMQITVHNDIFGVSLANHIERTPIIQNVTSLTMNQDMGAGSEGSSSSPAPKQQRSSHKMFPCTVCRAKFNTRSELNTHRASHTGGSPITCNMCGKVFVSKNTLGIHMRIHTGEKPYVCLLCGKRFTQNGGLRIHLRTHSGEKPFSCSVCHTSFNNPSNLRRHKIIHDAV
ncbi:zinc finger protein 160-like [Periophthalmus magnuspinnatus]|uniref:zinc finger protein 160-like n=1 Tax=Periophthalmus magnuspinnatus TaxID=409849 RepID=UPI00145B71CE|nr:zinc finger protein 160-like [Periophthalmus magnuspinnatus]